MRVSADLLISTYLADVSASEKEALRERLLLSAQNGVNVSEGDRVILPENLSTFHWELEFPEVFLRKEDGKDEGGRMKDEQENNSSFILHNSSFRSGFDAIVCNPPFMGGQKITGVLGTAYRDYMVEWIANGKRGSADLCAYFFLRGQELIRNSGGLGLVATNTISQGDTREVALDQLVNDGCIIPRAVPSRKWEGTASLEVAYIWLRKQEWKGDFILDEKPVKGITPYLTIPGKAVGKPHRLAANQSKSFIGSYVLGMGFILTPEEAQVLIEKNPRNKDVLFPYSRFAHFLWS